MTVVVWDTKKYDYSRIQEYSLRNQVDASWEAADDHRHTRRPLPLRRDLRCLNAPKIEPPM
jgi:hypothetical protein